MSEAETTIKEVFKEEDLLKAIQTLIDLNVLEQSIRPPDGKRIPPMRVDMGEQVFGEIERKLVVQFFLDIMDYFPRFYDLKPVLLDWKNKSGLKLHHIMAQSFLCWFNSRHTRRNYPSRRNQEKRNGGDIQRDRGVENHTSKENGTVFAQLDAFEISKEDIEARSAIEPMDDGEDVPKVSGNTKNGPVENSLMMDQIEVQAKEILPDANKSSVSASPLPRIHEISLTNEQRWAILRCLIPIDFPVRNRFLKLVVQALGFIKEHFSAIVDLIMQMSEQGHASFSSLFYCMREQEWMSFVRKPTILIQAMLLGPLNGDLVEFFLRNRDEKFREEAKKLILHAEHLTRDQIMFETAVKQWAHTTVDNVPPFPQFCTNVSDLMRDLRKEPPRNNFIDQAWGRHALKRAVRRYYVTKEFNEEQMNDIIHSILVQRPEMKNFVLAMLSKEHKDEIAYNVWRRFYPQRNERTKIRFDTRTVDLYTNKDGFLEIPRGVNVCCLNNVLQLPFIQQEIDKCAASDYPIVGLDAEWDSYVLSCRACLLQIAFRTCIYLIDLEAMRSRPQLVQFIQKFFASQKFKKIGFQFSEDLLQIRNTISKAPALYRPENVVCIGKLIEQLLQESGKRSDFNIEEFFQHVDDGKDVSVNESCLLNTSAEPEYDELEGPLLASGAILIMDVDDEKKKSESKKIASNIKTMGLSAICRRLLGKNLEKSEQCSVWDRRPLRSSQIRYAALDAYCILMLYDRCVQWAEKLGVNIQDLMAAQTPINFPLPLFWDGPR